MAITNGYTTLAQFKAAKGVQSFDVVDDAFLEDLITRVSRAIDDYCGGRTFYSRTETRYYDVPTDGQLDLDDDLLTVTTLTNGDATTVSASNYYLLNRNNPPYHAIRLKDSSGLVWQLDANGNYEQAITVTGTWGYVNRADSDARSARVISNTEAACLLIALAEYNKRYGTSPTGSVQVTGAGVVITPEGWPAEARAILDSYRKPY